MKKTREPKPWKNKADLLAKVEALTAQGMTMKEACQKIGCNFTYVYSIRREMAAKQPETSATVSDLTFDEFVRYKREFERIKGGQ